ncbi:MAG: hypothetical protein ACFB15_22655 [Cyclobacteriaceae bacterium]
MPDKKTDQYKITSEDEFLKFTQSDGHIENISEILVTNITFKGNVEGVSILNVPSIRFSHCAFNGNLEVVRIKTDNMVIDNCIFSGTAYFNGISANSLTLDKCIFSGYSPIIFSSIQVLTIESTFEKLFIGDSDIKTLFFNSNISGQVDIDEGTIETLRFSSTIENSGEVNIKRLRVNHIDFKYFTNHGILNIQTINRREKPDQNLSSSLSLLSADLGSATFLDFDFNSFKEICIESVKISKIGIYGISFPANSKRIFTGDLFEEKGKDASKLYELYNQLHVIMQRQGHRVNELLYYAEFMEWHLKDLWRKKENWPMITSLVLNKVSTNYGQSWLQGAVGTFIIAWAFYFLYTISLPGVNISLDNANWNDTTFFIGEYFNFLNPAHKVDFMKDLPPNWIASIWDFFGRIAVGFMIYQTISAFRRFGIR